MNSARVTVDLGNFETRLTFDFPEALQPLDAIGRPDPTCACTLSVPSVVHLGDLVLLGTEVFDRRLQGSAACFSDLKDHVLHRIGGGRVVDGTRVTYKTAASLFLTELLQRVRRALNRDLEIALLFPLLARESFQAWIRATALEASHSVTLLDEDTAVALGYGIDLARENLVLVFDFGFSSIRARILQFSWRGRDSYSPPWVRASAVSPAGYAELAPRLSSLGGCWNLRDPDASAASRPLEAAQLSAVRSVLDLLRDEAALVGVRDANIRKVLLTGRGITGRVQEALRREFGDRVVAHSPVSAAGRGGLVFLGGSVPETAVKELCTLQARDPITGKYYYQVVVEEWTEVPTPQPVASYVVNTYYDGQKAMDLRLFRTRRGNGASGPKEVVFGPDGSMALSDVKSAEHHEPAVEVPLRIPVDPPGRVGERRFRLEFKVNAQKDLLLTVEDLKKGRTLWDERSLFRLH